MFKAAYTIQVLRNHRVMKIFGGSSDSFVKQFIDLLYRQLIQSSFASLDITNTSHSQSCHNQQLQVAGAGGGTILRFTGLSAAGELIGIVVGTGTNAVIPTDVALQTKVAHGKAGGELWHYGTRCDEIGVSGADASFKIARIFENKSGGSITINELGIYAYTYDRYTANCILRDKLAAGVAVADGEILKIEYTVKVTV